MPGSSLGILLVSAGHERAHYAFMVAAGAAAIGRAVTLFATNEGCRALMPGVLDPAGLLPGVEVAGIPTFLSATGAGQVVTL